MNSKFLTGCPRNLDALDLVRDTEQRCVPLAIGDEVFQIYPYRACFYHIRNRLLECLHIGGKPGFDISSHRRLHP